MKTSNLILLGAAGVAAYFLFIKPKQDQAAAYAGAAGAVDAVGTGISSGIGGIVSGVEGAGSAVGGDISGFLSSAAGAINNLLSGGQSAIQGLLNSGASALGQVTTTTNPNSVPNAKAITPITQDLSYLVTNTPQIQIARAWNLPTSAINPAINYAQAPGYQATVQNAGVTMTGKYDPNTGSFINTAGQGMSIAPNYVKPVTAVASVVKPAPSLIAPVNNYFKW